VKEWNHVMDLPLKEEEEEEMVEEVEVMMKY
jgi:hypothetical protein